MSETAKVTFCKKCGGFIRIERQGSEHSFIPLSKLKMNRCDCEEAKLVD